MSNPKCPICNSNMIKRQAKRGANAGSYFWSCENYFITGCKGTLAIDQTGSTHNQSVAKNHNQQVELINHIIPELFRAKSLYKGFDSFFIQSISIPIELLTLINNETINAKDVRNYSQWRTDFKINDFGTIDQKHNEAFTLIHKLLTRGTLTISSRKLESMVKKLFKVVDFNFNPDTYLLSKKKEVSDNIDFENSHYEKRFFNEVTKDLLGEYFDFFCVPQVYIDSFTEYDTVKKFDAARVDFFISHGNRKIVVELDGIEHESHSNYDYTRDQILAHNGVEVFRIKNNENPTELIKELKTLQIKEKFSGPKELKSSDKYMVALKLLHQIQIVVTRMVLKGYNLQSENKIQVEFSSKFIDKAIGNELLKILTDEYNTLIQNVEDLFDIEDDKYRFEFVLFDKDSNDLLVTFNDNFKLSRNIAAIKDFYYPGIISNPSSMSNINYYKTLNDSTLEYFLEYLFRKPGFREGQIETIKRGLQGKDTLVLLPTGAGKSIAFQLTSLLLNGITIVIDPIISLIQDQIENLNRIGIDRIAGISGLITDRQQKEKTIRAFGLGEYLITFIAPERLQSVEFRDSIRALTTITPIPLVAIDEAHCVSEWGHDFRTSYLNIGRITREYCGFGQLSPCLVGLTGTASNIVLRDVQRELNIVELDAVITPKTFNRKELTYDIFSDLSTNKSELLKNLIIRYFPNIFKTSYTNFYMTNGDETIGGLIFCPHANGDFGVEKVKTNMESLGLNVKLYSGEKPKNHFSYDWGLEKSRIAREFKNNKFPLLVTTKAFGMGIDKPNINYTIHFGLPGSIESFYQEAGRAGRNGQFSRCILLLSKDNHDRANQLLDPKNSIEEVRQIMNDVKFEDADDVTRAMYFHVNSFKGISKEIEAVKYILSKVGSLDISKKVIIVPTDTIDRSILEKGLYRLIVLGVVEDYTLNFSSSEFTFDYRNIDKDIIIDLYAQYVSGYSKTRVNKETEKLQEFFDLDYYDFLVKASEVLIAFIYDTIEKGRRRAFSEMLQLAESANASSDKDKVIRERVMLYFQTTYSEEIDKILNADSIKVDFIRDLIDGYEASNGRIIGGLRSTRDAEEIRGQVSRYLESYPDNPGLLLVRALSEVFSSDYSKDIAVSSFEAAVKYGNDQIGYSTQQADYYELIAWAMIRIGQRKIDVYEELATEVVESFDNIDFAKQLIEVSDSNPELMIIPSVYVVDKMCEHINNILRSK